MKLQWLVWSSALLRLVSAQEQVEVTETGQVHHVPSPPCQDNHPEMCAQWQSMGACEDNVGFMLKECRKSCDFCNRIIPTVANDYGEPQDVIDDRTTPVIETTQAYMASLKQDDPAAFRGCLNQHALCSHWASMGGCHDEHKDFMRDECAPVCRACSRDKPHGQPPQQRHTEQRPRQNQHQQQQQNHMGFQSRGEQIENEWGAPQEVANEETRAIIEETKTYMTQVVFQEERFADVKDSCKNRHPLCSFWASMGGCRDENRPFMVMECAPTCQQCDAPPVETISTDFGVDQDLMDESTRRVINETIEYMASDEIPSDCVNKMSQCSFWAARGGCENHNEAMMSRDCRPACRKCLEPIKPLESRWGDAQDIPDEASQRMMEEMDDYMTNVVMVDPAYEKVRHECRLKHDQCAHWASRGGCHDDNKVFMTLNCAPMCKTCELVDYDVRCPAKTNEPSIWQPGDLNAMFEKMVTDPQFEPYVPVIHSKPGGGEGVLDGPWVVTYEDFLTPDECDHLIDWGARLGYEESVDVGPMGIDGVAQKWKNDRRTSTNAWCQGPCYEDPVVKRVLEKIENVTGIPDTNSEFLQLLKYEVGQRYGQHHDYIPNQGHRPAGSRILTVFLYLNDVEAGGGTNFPLFNLTSMPKRGKALIWPSVLDDRPADVDRRTEHEALPVEAGMKYGANAWVHERSFKKAADEGCL